MFAPSRVRGLKHSTAIYYHYYIVRTFTGAWIETIGLLGNVMLSTVRTFTGAWIETIVKVRLLLVINVRTFTGAWIETYGLRVLTR